VAAEGRALLTKEVWRRTRERASTSPPVLPYISDRPPSFAAFPSKSILVGTRRESKRAESFSSNSGQSRDLEIFPHPISHNMLVCEGLRTLGQDKTDDIISVGLIRIRNSSQEQTDMYA
jgi:hypothetical protein